MIPRKIFAFFEWCCNYVGFGAIAFKVIAVLMMAFTIVIIPASLYICSVAIGLQGAPFCYVVYASWLTFFASAIIGAAVVQYIYKR